jgi:hypothetical protein
MRLSNDCIPEQGQIAHWLKRFPKMACPRVGQVLAGITMLIHWPTAKSDTIRKRSTQL